MRTNGRQWVPLLVLTASCNAILGINAHELDPNAEGAGRGGAKAGAGAGQAGGDTAGAGGGSAGGGSAGLVGCAPGTKQCKSDGKTRQYCTNTRVWEDGADCPVATPFCNGEGICGICSATKTQCQGNTPQTCSTMGQWEDETACVGATICSVGVCVACPGAGGPTMVGLPLGYCIDSTEVTREQYQAWLTTNPSAAGQMTDCAWNTDYTPQGDWAAPITNPKNPVAFVDWCDAQAYCKAVGKRLCGKIGGGSNVWGDYADPTLSQWYAACASNGTYSYPYGNAYQAGACNGKGAGNGMTVEVGTMTGCQSPIAEYSGVYDLSGNVWEWEDSCSTASESAACRLRGGRFIADSSDMACAADANTGRKVASSDGVGFRCCAP